MAKPNNTPLVLIILDGWGYNPNQQHNAIAQAHTPQWDEWWQSSPHMLLDASGLPVGLPDQQMGNSEVGHMHIGAGRVIEQDFTRINQAIQKKELLRNNTLISTITQLQTRQKALHVMGLLSAGGVHSHETHLFALLELCHQQQFHAVYLHLFLDGRDTPPQSALTSLEHLQNTLQTYPVATINSISGRYYAMDRDNRWDRIEKVYVLLTEGKSQHHAIDSIAAIKAYYQQQITDEFIPPTRIGDAKPIVDGDAVLFFNFRADRARQLTAAFVQKTFTGFPRQTIPKLSHFISMTQYDKNLSTEVIMPPVSMKNTLGEMLAKQGLRQLRIAETEKYAHVTFFFNGGNEQIFSNEKRALIPSPKVATYDLQPEMSAPELTAQLVQAIQSQDYDVIICNYANADMVGHSGNFSATRQAIECLDRCLHTVWQAIEPIHGVLLITADHGNAEDMFDEYTNQAHTAHTNQPVPFLCVNKDWHFTQKHGSLIDIAPTMLALLGLTPPKEMTGCILLEKNHADS